MTGSIKRLAWIWVCWCACLAWAGPIAPPARQLASAVAARAVTPSATPANLDFSLEQPHFETVGDAQSPPGQTITALAQDASGFLWIGTQRGLVRYDGYRFRKFEHAAADPASLSGDYVAALWAAPDGKVWVGTFNDGVSVFDPVSEKFQNFQHKPGQPGSIGGGKISALLGDAKGNMWIATEEGLDYLPQGSQVFRHLRHQDGNLASLLSDQVNCLLQDRRGRLWVGSSLGLQRLAPDNQTFELIASDILDHSQIERHNIQSMMEAADGKLWLGTRSNGAAWLAAETRPSVTNPLHWLPFEPDGPDGRGNGWVRGIVQTQPDQIWLASHGAGIDVVAASTGRILQRLRHNPTLPNGLAFDQVKPFLLDRSGLLWLGTWGEGLQRVNIRHAMLRLLRHSQHAGQGLSHPDVRSLLALPNRQIWIGSSGNGIDIFEPGQGVTGHALPGMTVLALAHTSDGSIWASTQQAGVLRQLPAAKVWQALPAVPGGQVQRLFAARDGSLWAGSHHGLARWQAGQRRFEAINDASGSALKIEVSAFAEDEKGRIWVGSGTGLWVWDAKTGQMQRIHAQRGQPAGLISDTILSLLFDSQGRLWLSTDKGLERLQSWRGGVAQFEHINPLLGLPQKSLGLNLLEDPNGRIWSDEVVLQIEPGKPPVLTQLKAAGIDIAGSWAGSYLKTADGFLLYGNTIGITMINPALVRSGTYQVPLVATELKINGQTQPMHKLARTAGGEGGPETGAKTLLLGPGQRNFTLEFALLDFLNAKKTRYQYRLTGYDKTWIEVDAEHRNAAYGNLWPGAYRLQVRASDQDGNWHPHELGLALQINPAVWQTGWFQILALAVLAAIIYGVYRWRIRFLKRLVEERTADILKLGEIGRELTATLDTEQAFERVYRQVMARLDATVFSIGIYQPALERIVFVYEIENGQRLPRSDQAMSEHDRPAVWCVREQRELVVARNEELLNYVDTILPVTIGEQMETVVYQPLMIEQQVIGCLSVQSSRRHAYSRSQLKFLQILASYTAIALANSTAHAELTQAHDDLASLHRALQASQQQMVLQEKMAGLGTLAAGIAHEINNPTNFTHVAAQIQRSKIAELEQFVHGLLEPGEHQEIVAAFSRHFRQLDENVSTMLAGTERISAIVKDLRAFTRLDESAKKSVHLSACLRSTINLVQTLWQEKVEFVSDFADDPEIECWPALLNQVFMNLLINGCQAIAEKQAKDPGTGRGRLVVRLVLPPCQPPEQQTIAIAFEDNGSGMEESVQARILEPFYTTREVGSGTGLGLSIAFGIVQKHGGSLTFTSTWGVGSHFIVHLPLRAGAGAG
jgi:signal transduction histidine kinase/ligand-binding sensor domain-containing protein